MGGGGGGGTAGKGVGRAVSEGGNKKAGGAAGKRTAANENDTPTAGMQWFALVKAGASAKAYQVHRRSQSHCRLPAVPALVKNWRVQPTSCVPKNWHQSR